MEHVCDGCIIEFDGLWTDIGDWKRFYDVYIKNESNNVVIGDNIKTFGAKNSLIFGKKMNVVCIDIDNIAIVEYNGNIFISPINSCSKIKTYAS